MELKIVVAFIRKIRINIKHTNLKLDTTGRIRSTEHLAGRQGKKKQLKLRLLNDSVYFMAR